MKRSQREDANLDETRAVLLRLQRFSDDPDKVEFEAATSDASARPSRVATIAVSAVAAIALIAAGTFVLLGPNWPGGTQVASSPPVASSAAVAPSAPVVSRIPGASNAPGASSVPKLVTQNTPGGGAAMALNAPKITAQDRARAEQFLARGAEYLANGNVAGARDFFERAADIGLAAGALRLAETYDPGALQRLQAQGVVPDLSLARRWYERARELGDADAAGRLASLGAR